ncbi:hypothetical protein [Pedobacter sp. Hv1]|uniref:hypothetical protein n=1 Tax=Pedobacter sp. Hv1 TaxID=1740090 RepID=UPI0006D89015|nr:hypothetical protein [Pedobacter sp. Hv1]KQC02076.1 hypothetical protein AQF98_00445 [Pedobacter sp. Hv1]
MKLITIKTDEKGISIHIPKTLLVHTQRNHPEYPLIIRDNQKFMEAVAKELEQSQDNDTGLSKLQTLIDETSYDVADDCPDFCDFKEFILD